MQLQTNCLEAYPTEQHELRFHRMIMKALVSKTQRETRRPTVKSTDTDQNAEMFRLHSTEV